MSEKINTSDEQNPTSNTGWENMGDQDQSGDKSKTLESPEQQKTKHDRILGELINQSGAFLGDFEHAKADPSAVQTQYSKLLKAFEQAEASGIVAESEIATIQNELTKNLSSIRQEINKSQPTPGPTELQPKTDHPTESQPILDDPTRLQSVTGQPKEQEPGGDGKKPASIVDVLKEKKDTLSRGEFQKFRDDKYRELWQKLPSLKEFVGTDRESEITEAYADFRDIIEYMRENKNLNDENYQKCRDYLDHNLLQLAQARENYQFEQEQKLSLEKRQKLELERQEKEKLEYGVLSRELRTIWDEAGKNDNETPVIEYHNQARAILEKAKSLHEQGLLSDDNFSKIEEEASSILYTFRDGSTLNADGVGGKTPGATTGEGASGDKGGGNPFAGLTPEQIAERQAELAEKSRALDGEIANLGEKIQRRQLIAINGDFSTDRASLAKRYATEALNNETGFANKIFKGLFRKAFERKYERDIASGKMKVKMPDGSEKTIDEIIEARKGNALERITMGVAGGIDSLDDKFIHREAGEDYRVDKTATEVVSKAIKSFSKDEDNQALLAKAKEMGDYTEFNNAFNAYLKFQIGSTMDKGAGIKYDRNHFNNYANIAKEAMEATLHNEAMEDVLKGFQVYEAKVFDGARTKMDRKLFDKACDFLDNHGLFVAGDVLAVASGAAAALGRFGTKALIGTGGAAVAGAAMNFGREWTKFNNDRVELLYDTEIGVDRKYKNMTEDQIKALGLKGGEKKKALYEAKIGGTAYDVKKASDLIALLDAAKSTDGDQKAALKALAEARARIDFTDKTGKPLIAYSSADEMGSERLKLDIAVIELEKSLDDNGRRQYGTMENLWQKAISGTLEEDVAKRFVENSNIELSDLNALNTNKKDADFKRMRGLAAMKKAGISLGLSALSYVGTSEIRAIMDKNTIGLLEKRGLVKTENAVDAKETALARLFGGSSTYEVSAPASVGSLDSGSETPSGYKYVSDGDADFGKYNPDELVKINQTEELASIGNVTENVSPAESIFARNVKIDAYADNGTRVFDGNEVRAHIANGQFISTMRGASSVGKEALPSYENLLADGKVKAFVTVGGARLEVVGKLNEAGQLTWGDNGVFTVLGDDGATSTIRAIGENGEKLYKYFEIAMDNGVDAEGVQHIIPLATDIGANTFSDTISQTVEGFDYVTRNVYKVVERAAEAATAGTIEVPREVVNNGFAFIAPLGSRRGLGNAPSSSAEPGSSANLITPARSEQANNPPELAPTPSPLPPLPPRRPAPPAEGISRATGPIPAESASTPAESSSGPQPETTRDAGETSLVGAVGNLGEDAGAGEPGSPADNLPEGVRNSIDQVLSQMNLTGNLRDETYNLIFDDSRPNNFAPVAERYSSWWDSLSDSQKSQISEFVSSLATMGGAEALGRGIRQWVESRPE